MFPFDRIAHRASGAIQAGTVRRQSQVALTGGAADPKRLQYRHVDCHRRDFSHDADGLHEKNRGSEAVLATPGQYLSGLANKFRGFRDAQRIDLDASVVILTGPNGTGKTSVFDALQWLLLGSLKRLEPFRARKNTEHVANAFRGEEPAVVTAGLLVGDGEAEVQRRGRHEGGVLEWRDNDGVFRGEQAERKLARALL